jgi:hypothetical protein
MAKTFGLFWNQYGRKLAKLHALARRPGTPGERDAALAAIDRILAGIEGAPPAAQMQEPSQQTMQEPPPVKRPAKRGPRRYDDGLPLQMDQRVICDATSGVFGVCRCGSTEFIVAPGIGGHVAQLVCTQCPRGGRWLSRTHFGGAA